MGVETNGANILNIYSKMEEDVINEWLLTNSSNLEALIEE